MRLRLALALLVAPFVARTQQPLDSAYTARIRELTPTDPNWKFTTELVDHLPASRNVPSPLKVLGYVPGTIGRLSRTEDLNKYFRAVAARMEPDSLRRREASAYGASLRDAAGSTLVHIVR